MMDPQLCSEHLSRLLAEETTQLGELQQLLYAEHEVLLANELNALETASTNRQLCMSALLRIQDERRALLRLHGYRDDPDGINQLLNWCDPGQALKKRWSACLDQAARCRQSNDRNAALVAARLKRVEGLLEVIVGPGQHANVYSASGGQHGNRSGVLFATEA